MSIVADRLRAVTEETLEQMAFAAAMPSDEPFDWGAPDLVWASLRLRAPLPGELVCAAAPGTLNALALDAWGADTGPEGAEAFLAEALNVIGGRLLATLRPDVPPALGLPEPGTGPRTPGPDVVAQSFELDFGRIAVALTLDPAAPFRALVQEPLGGVH